MQELARLNLVRARERLHERPPRDPVLRALWEALPAAPEILRHSPHRSVLRLPAERAPDGRAWLLKLHHPRRRGERLRRLAPAPAARELALLRALGLGEGHAEQLAPDFGVFARPWRERAADGDWAAGLRALHERGWSDPDLAREDLLWTAGGELIPLDLGHARFTPGGAPPLARYADCAALAAELEATAAGAFLAAAGMPAELAALGRADRARRGWIRSARCLRTCSDFERIRDGARRRDFAAAVPHDGGEILAAGRRSRVVRFGDVVEKRYRRSGPGTLVRRLRPSLRPAARAMRLLHLLELRGLPAALGLGCAGECLWTRHVAGEPATAAALPELARWLRRLHDAGHGLRDPKPRNFVLGADGPVLVDADGIAPRLRRPERDLGRLFAEAPAGSALGEAAAAAYGPHDAAAAGRWAARFRRVLAAAVAAAVAG